MTLNTQFNKSCALAYFSTSWIQWNEKQWAHVWFLFSWGQCMWTMHWNRLKAAFENIKNGVVFCRLKTVPFCSVPLKTHSVQSPDNHHRYNSDFCSLGHDMPKFNTCHDKEIYKRMMVFELNLDSSINDWTNKQKKTSHFITILIPSNTCVPKRRMSRDCQIFFAQCFEGLILKEIICLPTVYFLFFTEQEKHKDSFPYINAATY